jgi:CheY-like chemotaxis protein
MEAVGQLTGGVAHDFNNLLMAVLGSLELVRKHLPYDPKISPLIENAILGAERGATLTQRMLAFARRQELRVEAVDVAELVAGVMGLVERSIGPSIRIETRFPPGLPPMRTDPNQLETALLNLALNARDAMPDGGTLTISAQRETVDVADETLAPGHYVRLCVSDTGEGMDADTLSRAPEPFFTTKGVGKGTGLGLSMVHGLATQSGGQLKITSRRGAGSTVELWLPAAAANAAAEPRPPENVPDQPASQPLKILAVDDDSLVLLNTVALLEDLGHEVLEASSGREALALLEGRPDIELMITDQAMPQMSGLQLAEAARILRPDLQVLIASGYAEIPEGEAAQTPRLSKPFTQAELALAVAEATTGARRAPLRRSRRPR